ncbi:MAG: undecaprenyl diphosphate synthase family protein [Nanoarchaeota archaeon]|nr:undecaprenyl diphosphate synthase family protein [Nanoarchaeota archaeon]
MDLKHIAFTTVGLKLNPEKGFQVISQLIDQQINHKIPVFTFHITHRSDPEPNTLIALTKFLESEEFRNKINQNKIKITALGKWYNLPSQTLDAVKKIIDETKDYDHYFLNLCLNYSGQEEIVDSCKLIIRQIFANKLSESAITKEIIKENLYTSYFIPPGLIIKSGTEQKQTSFLLWDSVSAQLHFTKKPFPEFTVEDLNQVLSKL